MAGNKNLKLKRPLEDDCGSTPQEAFKKAKLETQSHYRAMLYMQKNQLDAIVLKNEVDGELDKETLESELRLAKARMADVKVPDIDWFKLGEPNMYDE
ncbi:hypothetical protein Bca4012_027097 [Brassica carinata]|uniref:Uncharacterized protein n=1 Tax=Brassica carinata TaxID=52824 RepID=A0A8X7VJT9_BRACI|nr:hypothetical protein Bca52824_024101 [Brassica carinata]